MPAARTNAGNEERGVNEMQKTVGEILKEAWENLGKEYILPITNFEMDVNYKLDTGDVYINFNCPDESVCKEKMENGCLTCAGADLRR